MSTGPLTIRVAPRFEPTRPDGSRARSPAATHVLRVGSFAALALYGVIRWGTLMSPAPGGRLVGLAALAVAAVTGVPILRRFGRTAPIVLTVVLCLLALPMAGLPWHDLTHVRLAVAWQEISHGLSGLPGSYVPYVGGGGSVRLVIVLGAAILLLDSAIVLAFAPGDLGDGRRAGAALPLIALAVVPSTLLRPEFPYLQGLILFALLAAFMWAERIAGRGSGPLLLLAAAGVAGALLAPRLDQHRAWLNYRAWAGTPARGHADAFDWNQRYGPLHWPHSGHVVMTVIASHPDYWKAENLDVFNGYGWETGRVPSRPLPPPTLAAVTRWSQTIHVEVSGLHSSNVIASGFAAAAPLPGAVPGAEPGTWTVEPPLTPGSSYTVTTYSPHPTPTQLAQAGTRYPQAALAAYRTLTLPLTGTGGQRLGAVRFAPFHSTQPAVSAQDTSSPVSSAVADSPYGPMYVLARRLAARAATPYQFAESVWRLLNDGAYSYNESPPARRYPLPSFLFRDRIGYCQQFSGAMALLLRMGGLPTRVAAGFTPGSRGASQSWIVSDIDAHAWVEVWFPRYGWVRFDPTPATAPARGGDVTTAIEKKLPGLRSPLTPSHPRQSQAAPTVTAGGRGPSGSGGFNWLVLPAAAVVLLLAAAGVATLRPVPSVEDRLRELERALARTGRPVGPDMTLAALERRFHESPAASGYIRSLRLDRYAGARVAPDPAGRRALREELRRGLGLSGRLRALWALPPWPNVGRGRRPRDLD